MSYTTLSNPFITYAANVDDYEQSGLYQLIQESASELPGSIDVSSNRKEVKKKMAERIIEEHVHTDGGGSGALTALVVVLFLLVMLVVLYFTGTLGRMFGTQKHEIDININKPSVILQVR